MLKPQQAVCNIDDILAVIQNESKQFTKKFDFFIVEKVRWFQKRLANSREYCKIDGIMALHFLKFDGHMIVLRDLTCSECSIDAFCDDCKTLKQIDKTNAITPEKVEYLDLTDIENTDSNNNEDAQFHYDDEQGQTDESDESSEDEEEEFNPGDVMWAKHGGIWYPAQICSLNDVPSNLQHRFLVQNNKVIVKWFRENNFSSVNSSQIDVLGENLVDAARAAKSTFIMEQCNIALGKRLSYT